MVLDHGRIAGVIGTDQRDNSARRCCACRPLSAQDRRRSSSSASPIAGSPAWPRTRACSARGEADAYRFQLVQKARHGRVRREKAERQWQRSWPPHLGVESSHSSLLSAVFFSRAGYEKQASWHYSHKPTKNQEVASVLHDNNIPHDFLESCCRFSRPSQFCPVIHRMEVKYSKRRGTKEAGDYSPPASMNGHHYTRMRRFAQRSANSAYSHWEYAT